MQTTLRLTVFLLLLAPALAPAKIYKWILPDGTITYSDKPQYDGAKEVELPRLQTYTPPATPAPRPPADANAGAASADSYESVKIVAPENGSTMRDNGGTVSVQIALEPSLQAGHVVEILVDGKSVGSGPATSASLSNLDRGSHTISAVVKDADGNVLANAGGVTFHLKRTSKLQPGRVPPPPPPAKP